MCIHTYVTKVQIHYIMWYCVNIVCVATVRLGLGVSDCLCYHFLCTYVPMCFISLCCCHHHLLPPFLTLGTHLCVHSLLPLPVPDEGQAPQPSQAQGSHQGGQQALLRLWVHEGQPAGAHPEERVGKPHMHVTCIGVCVGAFEVSQVTRDVRICAKGAAFCASCVCRGVCS